LAGCAASPAFHVSTRKQTELPGNNHTQAEAMQQECHRFYNEHYFFNALRQSGQNSSPDSILTSCSCGESFLPQMSQHPLFPETD